MTLLLSAIIGCWYAYQQNKNAKRHLRRMAKDMEGLQRAENSLAEMQKVSSLLFRIVSLFNFRLGKFPIVFLLIRILFCFLGTGKSQNRTGKCSYRETRLGTSIERSSVPIIVEFRLGTPTT